MVCVCVVVVVVAVAVAVRVSLVRVWDGSNVSRLRVWRASVRALHVREEACVRWNQPERRTVNFLESA